MPIVLDGLSANGHEVHLLAAGAPDPRIAGALADSDVNLDLNVWNGPGLVEDLAPRLAKWVNSLKPDVFVVSTSPDIGWVVLPLLAGQIGTVSIAHADVDAYYQPLSHYSAFVTRAVGVSTQICENLTEKCSVPRESVDWIPYGVVGSPKPPRTAESSEGNPLRIAYVGRLAEVQKRVTDLIKIAKELSSRKIDYVFEIIGDGPMMPSLKQSLELEVSENRVKFYGWLHNKQVAERLRNAHVSLLVSDTEGFPIAVVEAMANGCAPIVTDIEAGTRQLVDDGVSGFICQVGATTAFADRIQSLASDRSLLEIMRLEAWKTGKEYSTARMVDRYQECFERASADAKKKPRKTQSDFPLMASCRSRYPLWLRRSRARAKRLLRVID